MLQDFRYRFEHLLDIRNLRIKANVFLLNKNMKPISTRIKMNLVTWNLRKCKAYSKQYNNFVLCCFTNNVRELTSTKYSDYNVIVQGLWAEQLCKFKTLFKCNWLKGERDKKIECQDGLWFEVSEWYRLWFEGNEWDGLWFEGNEWYYDKSRDDVRLSDDIMMKLCVMKSIREQRDDQNPNFLISISSWASIMLII